MEVIETNIPFSKSLKDISCWKDEAEYKSGVENNKYFRMRLVSESISSILTMEKLHSLGIKGWIQKPRKLEKNLVVHIEKAFN